MKDFTLKIYQQLLETALTNNYTLTSFEDFLQKKPQKAMILRHDVDKKPINSLKTAQLQHKLGVKGTYYFRCTKESFNETIIKQIAALGHEIGYHYEDLTLCKGDTTKAIAHFECWLDKLRKFYPVTTICMHGSPTSKWDNRKLWEHFNYKDYGLIAEPYFDIDFNTVFYLTDTGRKWDGSKVSVRDKVTSHFNLSFHTTQEIIAAFNANKMPNLIMQNIHPQRWTDNNVAWLQEVVMQNIKNTIKKAFFVVANKE